MASMRLVEDATANDVETTVTIAVREGPSRTGWRALGPDPTSKSEPSRRSVIKIRASSAHARSHSWKRATGERVDPGNLSTNYPNVRDGGLPAWSWSRPPEVHRNCTTGGCKLPTLAEQWPTSTKSGNSRSDVGHCWPAVAGIPTDRPPGDKEVGGRLGDDDDGSKDDQCTPTYYHARTRAPCSETIELAPTSSVPDGLRRRSEHRHSNSRQVRPTSAQLITTEVLCKTPTRAFVRGGCRWRTNMRPKAASPSDMGGASCSVFVFLGTPHSSRAQLVISFRPGAPGAQSCLGPPA